ncbi:ATP-binding protein [Microbacterium sp. PRC9]|uniref:ATP-binding protein n=1 Tax=Microbacterium sp. PRC9 TaxID=2962591 RepID=UPI0028823E38|nr:ATP-binding protein [Microbacterium sp. PRC9]MDT0141971.1 ATP-binding protein [Microbacterium sp. PRC9]
MTTYNFTVDAALLRELGERLVGRPYMALAELIKNSYDADATDVEINFAGKSISVADNGHGMSETDFAERWMRIGTTRKAKQALSPKFKRGLTGSKGVGRLAVQILGRATEVTSRALVKADGSSSELARPIQAKINWDAAVRRGELTSVTVDLENPATAPTFPGDKAHGTVVTISELADVWGAQDFTKLAREIWALRPPFEDDSGSGMRISLRSDSQIIDESFNDQMEAILDIWSARITGRLMPRDKWLATPDGVLPPRLPSMDDDDQALRRPEAKKLQDLILRIDVEVKGAAKRTVHYLVPSSPIGRLRFDIRVFSLQNRQPKNVSVTDAREYLRRYGGVNLFDGGFRLPYYGVDQDWLEAERDHARRLDRSRLVPEALQVKKGLLDLPPNSRMYGVVQISTAEEAKAAARRGGGNDPLSIQVSRDRLTDNPAYQQLRVLVRAGLDLYAMETARIKLLDVTRLREKRQRTPTEALGILSATVERARDELASDTYAELRYAVQDATEAARLAEASSSAYASLLGALATAGSTSLAYEHEISKQVAALQDLSEDLTEVAQGLPQSKSAQVLSAVERMRVWQERVAGIRAVFGPLLSKESRDTVERYRARSTVRKVVRDLEPLASGIKVDVTGIPNDLMFPPATLPAWTSILQNVLLNSYNALSDAAEPAISVVGTRGKTTSRIQVLDNGVGVPAEGSERLWQPFHRELLLSPEKEAAGLGGMGLGLTIVRMISDEIGVRANFVTPPTHFKTALQLEWREPSDDL